MKNQPLTIFLFLCLLASYGFFTYAHGQTSVVTAAEYCDFLNQNAASDPDNLFDEKMEANPETACVVRLGTPGKYYYQVIAGRGNFPVMYVNDLGKEKYCTEKDNIISNDDEDCDGSLKSNLRGFAVDGPASAILTFASAPISHLQSSISLISEAAGIVALIAFGSAFVTLGDFREALADPANAGAERLIVMHDAEGNNVIRAQAARNGASARSQNIEIIDHLRTALESEHSQEAASTFIAAEIPALSLLHERSSRLGIERLQRILAAAGYLRRAIASNEVNESEHSITAISSDPVIEKVSSVKKASSVKTPDLVFQALAGVLRWRKNECLPFNSYTKMPGKYFQLSSEFPIAQRLVAYIEECYRNAEDKKAPIPLNSFHLAAIDRMEEALKLRVEAMRQTENTDVAIRLEQAASRQEKAAACIIKALVNQRAGDSLRAQRWASLGEAMISNNKDLADLGIKAAKAKINYRNREDIVELWANAITAMTSGNHQLSDLWTKTAMGMEKSVIYRYRGDRLYKKTLSAYQTNQGPKYYYNDTVRELLLFQPNLAEQRQIAYPLAKEPKLSLSARLKQKQLELDRLRCRFFGYFGFDTSYNRDRDKALAPLLLSDFHSNEAMELLDEIEAYHSANKARKLLYDEADLAESASYRLIAALKAGLTHTSDEVQDCLSILRSLKPDFKACRRAT
ncbi:MAG: hypothetical protein ACH346_03960 [Chthoniobacterales bacterium]